MNPFEKYILNGHLIVDDENWLTLKNTYDKEDLITFISDKILDGSIVLPLREITEQDAIDSFKGLCDYKCNDFFYDKIFTRYNYTYELNNKYIDESSVGNVASDYFQQFNRFCCGHRGSPSPYRVWNNRKFLHSMLSALWSLKCKNINDSVFRTLLSLRKYVASQYKPAIAKSIYEKYNSKDILDFSSGWGDRLCGFYATQSANTYIGIDPNTAVYNKYFEQIDLYKSIVGEKQVKLYNLPAEDVKLPKNIVDTVFTSPPYFNIERYSEDDTQSFKRYKNLDTWLESFLYVTIDNVWYSLKDNGYLIVNVSDAYSNHIINHICDPMNDYIKSIGGTFIEGYGMKMGKRPNSKSMSGKEGVFVEPIWVWQKR